MCLWRATTDPGAWPDSRSPTPADATPHRHHSSAAIPPPTPARDMPTLVLNALLVFVFCTNFSATMSSSSARGMASRLRRRIVFPQHPYAYKDDYRLPAAVDIFAGSVLDTRRSLQVFASNVCLARRARSASCCVRFSFLTPLDARRLPPPFACLPLHAITYGIRLLNGARSPVVVDGRSRGIDAGGAAIPWKSRNLCYTLTSKVAGPA
eukprot:scaffold15542_cov112-Isochrysis_galbana.AAC.6